MTAFTSPEPVRLYIVGASNVSANVQQVVGGGWCLEWRQQITHSLARWHPSLVLYANASRVFRMGGFRCEVESGSGNARDQDGKMDAHTSQCCVFVCVSERVCVWSPLSRPRRAESLGT